jgi:hypothetical protein
MTKVFTRYTLRTEDKHRRAVLKPLVHPFQATERLCQYEETGLSPEAVRRLQLLWRTLVEQIVEHAKPFEKKPDECILTLATDLLQEFRAELEGRGMRSDDGVLITQTVAIVVGVDMASEPDRTSKILLN